MVKRKMLICFHGKDNGNVLLISVILIFSFSILFMSITKIVSAKLKLTDRLVDKILDENDQINMELKKKYDLY